MDLNSFLQAFLATSTPVLPALPLSKAAYPIFWAALFAWLALALGGRLRPPVQLAFVALVVVWALLPGDWSPVYWLGLAFQMPSWTSVLLALAGVAALLRKSAPVSAVPLPLLFLASVMGWVMLLDLFVYLPFALYRWGFSVAAVAVAVVVAALLWRDRGDRSAGLAGEQAAVASAQGRQWWPWLLPAVLLLFVITRLPSGNVFDALLDPWLWLAAQVALVKRLWLMAKRP